MATTNYSLITPTVGADLNTWGGDLNSNTEKLDDLLGGDQPITGIDINSGSIDGTPVGANSASTGAFTTASASGGFTGNLTGNVTGNVTGNASSATTATTATQANKWTTARTISLTGTITGSTSMDGSGNVSIATSGGLTNAQVANIVYPVGCLYETTSTQNPATTFGVGTWSLFGQGRVTVCIDTGQTEFNVNGETGGAKTHTLTTNEMPSHVHGYTGVNGTGNPDGAADSTYVGNSVSYPRQSELDYEGGGAAHNNLQPYIVVYRWKRVS